MRIGRRSLVFLLLAVICLALLPLTPADFRWVNLSMAGLALFWSVLLVFEDLSRERWARSRRGRRP